MKLARLIWAYRTELAAGCVAYYLMALMLANGAVVGGSIVAVLLALVVGVGPVRRWVRRLFSRARLRRRFRRACRHAGLANDNDRVPAPVRITTVPAGHVVRARVQAGSHAGPLTGAAPALAAYLGAKEVRVAQDRDNARYVDVTVVRRDPLATKAPLAWPLVAAPRICLWDPIPVGIGEDGQMVTVSLPERNVLVGGEPGAGKSVALSMLVAAAALDPAVRISLFDGKLVELGLWQAVAEHFVGPDQEQAIKVLEEIRDDMEERYRYLGSHRRRKLVREDVQFALRLVVLDELALYTATGDRKLAAQFANLLRDLVARGRAAGIIVLAATQRPSSDIVPTSLRDLFGFRWALRCSTRDASDTILGAGWATNGFSASSIDASARGVGFLLHEGGQPIRLRSCYLADADLEAIADRAEALRHAPAPAVLEPVPGEEPA